MTANNYLYNLGLALKIYNYVFLGVFLTLWIILRFIPNGFIPDYFGMEQIIVNGSIETFIRITISFIGFLIAFLILAFGMLREKFQRQAFDELLSNFYVKHIVTLSIGLILLLTLTLFFTEKQAPTYSDLNVTYLSVISSIIYIFLLFPLLILSIGSIDSVSYTHKIIEKIQPDHFDDNLTLKMGFDDKNPILKIRKLLSYSLSNNDETTTNGIIYQTADKVLSMIDQTTSREDIDKYFDGLILIWQDLIDKSKKDNYAQLEDLFILFEFFNKEFTKKRVNILHLNELIFFIEKISSRLSMVEDRDVLSRILNSLEITLLHQIENAPNEKDIANLQIRFKDEFISKYGEVHVFGKFNPIQIDFNLHWDKISHDIPYIYSEILSGSIKTNNLECFEDAIRSINSLISFVIRADLGPFQKEDLLRSYSGIIYYGQIEAIKKNLIHNPEDIQAIDTSDISSAIKDNANYLRALIIAHFEFLYNLHKLGMLRLPTDYVDDPIGIIGRHYANSYDHKESAKRGLDFILKGVRKLKSHFENELDSNTSNYLYLKSCLESFQEWHLKDLWETQDPMKEERPNPKPNKKLLKTIEKDINSYLEVSQQDGSIFLHRDEY